MSLSNIDFTRQLIKIATNANLVVLSSTFCRRSKDYSVTFKTRDSDFKHELYSASAKILITKFKESVESTFLPEVEVTKSAQQEINFNPEQEFITGETIGDVPCFSSGTKKELCKRMKFEDDTVWNALVKAGIIIANLKKKA